jgi:hypothetical protein
MMQTDDRLSSLKEMVRRKLEDIKARKAAGEVFKPAKRRGTEKGD